MQEAMEEAPERCTTSSNGLKEDLASKDSPCHGLHKRYHTITSNNESWVAADTLVAQHLIIRSESPSITPERMISSCMDSPSATSSGNASRFSTPNHKLLKKKPPPLSPYRSSSFGTPNINHPVVGLRKPPSLDDRQRSLGSRSSGTAGINHDANSCPNWNNVCTISSGLSYTTQNNIPSGLNAGNRNIEGLRPRRNTLVYANLIMAILLSILNIAFVSRESLKVPSSPSYLPTAHPSSVTSNKRRKRDSHATTNVSPDRTATRHTAILHPPRIICLGCQGYLPSTTQPSKYAIDSYSAEFSDFTQLYPKLASNDILPIKPYDPLLNDVEGYGNCVPVNSSWQITYHPSCNSLHELDLKVGLRRKSVDLFGFKGFWRHAWKIIDDDFLSGYLSKRFLSKYVYNGNMLNRDTQSSTLAAMAQVGLSAELPHVVLKTLRYEHNYEELIYEINRIDAVAMERLTPSPYVMDIYGFCGMSAITEFGQGNFKSVVDEATPLEKLKYAHDVAAGLASAHYIDGYDNNITLIHNDLNPSNVMMNHGNAKLNDFNVGIMMTWHRRENRPCRFKSVFANAQWRAPEEQFIDGEYSNEPLSEKIDVYALGNIFFRIIAGHDPWKEYKVDGRISSEDQNDIAKHKRFDGDLPDFLDPELVDTSIPEIKAIYDVMLKCFQKLPNDRPTAIEIERELTQAYTILAKQNLSSATG